MLNYGRTRKFARFKAIFFFGDLEEEIRSGNYFFKVEAFFKVGQKIKVDLIVRF